MYVEVIGNPLARVVRPQPDENYIQLREYLKLWEKLYGRK